MHESIGLEAKDRITGFEGIVTGRSEYITGCAQLLVAAQSKDGKPGESGWYDEQRVEFKTASRIVLDNSATPGPCEAAPIR